MDKSKKIVIIAVIILVLVVALVMVFSKLNENRNSSKSNLDISSTQDMKNLIEKMYEGIETFPSVETTEIDVTDLNLVTYVTGLTSSEKIENIVISEPMMRAQAYSLVLVKVKNNNDADDIAKQMNENIDARKWICVEAEKVYTTSSGNIVCLVMSSEEMAKPVYDRFKQIAGGIGNEYVRDTNEGIIDEQTVL